MKGTFSTNKKAHKNFVWIEDENGIEYFCYKDAVKPDDWQYCYTGNTCQFIPSKDEYGGKHLRATHVVPHRIPDPELSAKQERRRIQKEQEAANRERKRLLREKAERNAEEAKKKREEWDKKVKQKLAFTPTVKDKYKWCAIEPLKLYRSSEKCGQKIKELEREYPKEKFRTASVMLYKINGQPILKELTEDNKMGDTLEFVTFE